jgi:hypothetical protein
VPWRKLERAAGFIALFCIGTLVLMFARPSVTNASKPQRGIPDPVLALQMAHDVSDVDAILGDSPSPDREVMRLKQYEDFAFIAGYAALYLTLALLLARRYPRLRLIAIVAAISGMAAAALDVTENLAILRIVNVPLATTTQLMVDAIRNAAIPKWGLGFVALGLLAIYFLRDRRRSAKIVGGIDVLAAVIGLVALIQNTLLPGAAGLIGLGLIGATVVLLFIP